MTRRIVGYSFQVATSSIVGTLIFQLTCLGTTSYAESSQSSPPIETVVATAKKISAKQIKHDAQNISDVRLLDDIQKLPDANLADAIQRTPGVSIVSANGESRFVNIRGMDADLNSTTFDGIHLTTANAHTSQGGGRAAALDVFPTGMVGGLEIIKSYKPDMDAEGLGGAVNILPRIMPADRRYFVDVRLGSGLESLHDTPIWDGEATLGVNIGASQMLSVIGTYSYHADWRGVDDLNAQYSDPAARRYDELEFRRNQYHRVRQAAGGSARLAVSDNTEFYLRGFSTGYTENLQEHSLVLSNLANASSGSSSSSYVVTAPNANVQQIFNLSKELVHDLLGEIGGKTALGNHLLLDFRTSWTRGSDKLDHNDNFAFQTTSPMALTYDASNPTFPSITTTNGVTMNDPSLYQFGSGSNTSSLSTDTEASAALNIQIPFHIGRASNTVKFGASARQRSRHADAFAGAIIPTTTALSTYTTSADQFIFGRRYDIGLMANMGTLAGQPQQVPASIPSSFEHDDENVDAGYISYELGLGNFSLLAGARYEMTTAVFLANSVDASEKILGSITHSQHYSNLFPDVSVKWEFSPRLLMRAAYTSSIARPGFNQITAATNIDFDKLVVSMGNTELKPTTAQNIDWTVEYYRGDSDILSGSLFHKSFSNYIIPTTRFPVILNLPYSGIAGKEVTLESFANIGSAHLNGFEVNYVRRFAMLPHPFDGLGIDANLTMVETRGDIRPGEMHSLPDTSPLAYNFALFFERGGWNFRIGTNFQARNLWRVGSDKNTDLYVQPRMHMDFGSSYRIDDVMDYYFDVKNITDTPYEITQGTSKDLPIRREFYGTDFLTGIRLHL